MKKALILIDYINEICHPDGKVSSCAQMINNENIITKVNSLICKARQQNWLIVWIIVGFEKNYIGANLNSPIFSRVREFNALQKDTWGTQLLDVLDYSTDELIIYKNAVNPFHGTNLDHVLRAQNINEVYLAGVSTEMAIQSCTRDAHDRGYIVNVIGDCCASGNLENHDASLKIIKSIANVINHEQVIL